MGNEIITKETIGAATEVRNYLVSSLKTEKGIHVGTLVAAAARLAGTTSMRSMKLPLDGMKSGAVVLSEQANEEGPKLMGLLQALLKANGIVVKDNDVVMETPKEQQPQQDLLQTQSDYEATYRRIMRQAGLDSNHAAYAGTLACAMLIKDTEKVLDPRISCGIAAYALVESMKTVPAPLNSD